MQQYIWVIGCPRSGTTYLTYYLVKYTDITINEPFSEYQIGRPEDWVLPTKQRVVFKYCENCFESRIISKKFTPSYFVHIFRDPLNTLYSILFPKPKSVPPRNLCKRGTPKEMFKAGIDRWYFHTKASFETCTRLNGINISYENLLDELDELGNFLSLDLEKPKDFRCRNSLEVIPNKMDWIKEIWEKKEFAYAMDMRLKIEKMASTSCPRTIKQRFPVFL